MSGEKLRINNSRYGDKRYLEEIGDKQYLIYGKSYFMRWLGDDLNNPDSIDFEGGPFISVGDNLKEDGYYKDVIVDKFEHHPNIERTWSPDSMSCFKIISK